MSVPVIWGTTLLGSSGITKEEIAIIITFATVTMVIFFLFGVLYKHLTKDKSFIIPVACVAAGYVIGFGLGVMFVLLKSVG